MLGLQQSAGNAAVHLLVQRSPVDGVLVQRADDEAHVPLKQAPGAAGAAPAEEEEPAVQRKPVAGAAPGGMLQRSAVGVPAMLVQRFTDEDVKIRAKELWERKGSPQNQSKEEQDKDWSEARRQLETEDRSHGIWEDKGKPQNQSEAEKKKDYSDAELQLKAVKDLDAAADAGAVKAKLLELQKNGTEWRVLRFVFKTVKSSVGDLIRGDGSTKTLAFGLAPNAADKAELIYFLKGDEAWKKQAMTDNGVDDNVYREALVRLGVFEKGLAPHKTGPEVDALIQKHLSKFVERNLEARGRVTGRVAVLDDADWDIAGRANFGADWPTEKVGLNAYVDRSSDPPRVFINKDRGNAGTAIHEGVHFWGSPARPINTASHELNEGVTEYFARKVCSALDPPIARTVYAEQFAIATKMVGVVGEEVVASAFFDGNLGALKAAFLKDDRWDNFCTSVEGGHWAAAEVLLTKLQEKIEKAKPIGDFDLGNLFDNIA
jgi:hypothetical protein